MNRLITTLFCALSFVHLGFSQQPKPEEIIRKMEERMRGETAQMELSMTIVRPRFTREISMRSWAKGEDYSLILITGPARDRGTAFLKRYKEIWNYLPTVDRMIKLPPSMMGQSWMGSDFSNDDLVRESSTINDFNHRILRSEKIDGLDCWVIESIPKPESSIVFSKIILWISKENFYHLRSENFDERGERVSTVVLSDIKTLGNRSMPTRMEMTPDDKPGHKTILVYTKAVFDEALTDDFFSVQNLKSIR
ncbi:MAG: outer membrane lipoprotein-sorting protein [Flavobacteriales bacterium]|nr:MAG: outer membrane lipoprotein-sorting protein [Flavobacteriales bacterium]